MALLKFTSQDLFNTALLDAATSQLVFQLSTAIVAGPSSGAVRRQTEIRDAENALVGSIGWVDRTPTEITILDESVGGLVDLFATKTVAFIPKELTFPSRFDTEYLWTATPEALYLWDYDSEARIAELHLRAPAPKPAPAARPGRGAACVRLAPHPLGLASDVEILVSLLMLDILRRGRFGLAPYAFGPPSRLQRVWARLRPRRNTV